MIFQFFDLSSKKKVKLTIILSGGKMNNLKKMNNPEKIWTHRLIPEASSDNPNLCPVGRWNEEVGKFEVCGASLKGAEAKMIKTDFRSEAEFWVFICSKCGAKIFPVNGKERSVFPKEVVYGGGRFGRICPFCNKNNGTASAILVNTQSGVKNGIRCRECDKWFFAPNAF
jgi:DNA-directed RNA polymerase subunit RPC12/RpoP